jgi:hypothetical protein
VPSRSDIDLQKTGRQSISVEDSMSMVRASSGLVHPPSEYPKSEVSIVCAIAKATLLGGLIDWSAFEENYDLIRGRIVFAVLWRDFNRRIRQPGGFHLPIPPRDRAWNTPTGRGNFEGGENPPLAEASILRLATLRSHNQYNTTIYGLGDRYRGVFGGRMAVFIDMKERGSVPGALVEIESLADDGQRYMARGFLARPYAIPQGSIGVYYPENQSIAPVDLPRCQKQDAGGEVDPRLGQAAVRGMQRSVGAHKQEEARAPPHRRKYVKYQAFFQVTAFRGRRGRGVQMAFGDRCQPPANCARMAPSYEPRAASGRFDQSLAGDPIAEEQHFVLSITKSNGMGMRLSTWCSIVEAHEGRLWVISDSPIGDVFQFRTATSAELTFASATQTPRVLPLRSCAEKICAAAGFFPMICSQ